MPDELDFGPIQALELVPEPEQNIEPVYVLDAVLCTVTSVGFEVSAISQISQTDEHFIVIMLIFIRRIQAPGGIVSGPVSLPLVRYSQRMSRVQRIA